jgi:hypothetical protein
LKHRVRKSSGVRRPRLVNAMPSALSETTPFELETCDLGKDG